MLGDTDVLARKLAVDPIPRIRNERRLNPSECPRKFRIPKVNFKAKKYFEMIDWANESISEPPLTLHLTGMR